jgi:hypothetical protein
MEINLELLQQLPVEEQAEDGLCYLTCSFSLSPPMPDDCSFTGF